MAQFLYNLTTGKALLIGLAIAVGYYFFLYDDGSVLQKQIQVAEQKVNQDKTQIAAINKAIDDAKIFVKVKAALGSEMQTVQKAIPSNLTSLDFMQTISNQAKTVGLQIDSVSPSGDFRSSNGQTDNSAFFEPVGVSVQLTGTYNQVMEFMSALTALDKIVTVSSLEMTAQNGYSPKSSTPVLDFKAEVSAYRFISSAKGAGG